MKRAPSEESADEHARPLKLHKEEDADVMGDGSLCSTQRTCTTTLSEESGRSLDDNSSRFGARMLKKFGWEDGKGIGKSMNGIKEPIVPNERVQRAGIGISNAEYQVQEWVSRDAVVVVDMEELPTRLWSELEFNCSNLSANLVIQNAPQETTGSSVCAATVLKEVNDAKTALDELWENDSRRFRSARARANPYEQIASAHFQNRAALKLAELDASFAPMLNETPLLPEECGVLFFADICAGPGGFTEYLYWRRKWRCKGWGFTIKGDCDFNLSKFNTQVAAQTFETEYGPHGDGDIFKKENIQALRERVLKGTCGRGVALVTADGGFSTDGDWNRQEFLTKRLLLCQMLTALSILREGGTFVCKMFDTFQDFTVELLYIMAHVFQSVCVTKPVQSRPANSERFLVCRGLVNIKDTQVVEYLSLINDKLEELGFVDATCKPTRDIAHIVEIKSAEFLKKMQEFVERVARRQVVALRDITRYYNDRHLLPPADQVRIREHALKLWMVPPNAKDHQAVHLRRKAIHEQLQSLLCTDKFKTVIGNGFNKVRFHLNGSVTSENMASVIVNTNWRSGILVSLFNKVMFVDHYNRDQFEFTTVENLRLPNGTVAIVERTNDANYYIVDVHMISWEKFNSMRFYERIQAARELTTSVAACNKPRRLIVHPKLYLPAEEAFSDASVSKKEILEARTVLLIPTKTKGLLDSLNDYRVWTRTSDPLYWDVSCSDISKPIKFYSHEDRSIDTVYCRDLVEFVSANLNQVNFKPGTRITISCVFDYEKQQLAASELIYETRRSLSRYADFLREKEERSWSKLTFTK